MGAKGAVEILYRREIRAAEDPAAHESELQADYAERFANPFAAAARGYVDDVIDPRETRARLISAFDMLQNKRDSNPPKKHGNLPL
jgi:propionyl-CoA carboxylase beta chain